MTVKKGSSTNTKQLAQQLAANVREKGYSYDRALCKRFQESAGIPADGIYGPQTKKAIEAAGVEAPNKLFVGAGEARTVISDEEESGSPWLAVLLLGGLAWAVFKK